MNDPLNNLPAFWVGQKVVYITGINMPKGSIHTVTEMLLSPCGCWHMGINGVPILYRPTDSELVRCSNCGKLYDSPVIVNGNNWEPNSFRPLQQQNFPLMSFEKIVEKERTEILINN